MVRQFHRLNGHESEETPGNSRGQGSLVCYSPWGRKQSDMTQQMNSNNKQLFYNILLVLPYSKMNHPYMHIFPLLFGFPSHSGHQSTLSRVSYALQQVLTSYLSSYLTMLFYTQYQQCLTSSVSSVQSLSHVQLFATPWTAAHQASRSVANSQNVLKLMSIELVMSSNLSSSVFPFFSHLQSFPASGSFQTSQFFASGGQRIGVLASVSVLPMYIQD